jgi:hypothetical protein
MIFFNLENWGNSQNGKKKIKELGQFLEPALKTAFNDSHQKVRTTQHWFRVQSFFSKNK